MDSGSKTVIIAALIGNGLIAATKFVASFITGSSAMLSEGIHSVIDTSDQILLLLGMKKAKQPADVKYPYGHGKEIYFWSFVVAIMIFAVGAGLSVYEGIRSLMDPHEVRNPMVNYIVLGVSAIFEGSTWYISLKEFRRVKGNKRYIEAITTGKDPTKYVVLFEDSAALLGLLVAFLGIFLGHWTGILIFDGIASIIIGCILGVTAGWLAHETKGLLIGESADPEIVESINHIVQSHQNISAVNETLTMHMGPQYILLNLSVDFKHDLKAGAVEKTIEKITKEIRDKNPRVKRVFVEAEEPKMRDTQLN